MEGSLHHTLENIPGETMKKSLALIVLSITLMTQANAALNTDPDYGLANKPCPRSELTTLDTNQIIPGGLFSVVEKLGRKDEIILAESKTKVEITEGFNSYRNFHYFEKQGNQ